MQRILSHQLPAYAGRTVRLAGWVHRRRVLKGVAFLILRLAISEALKDDRRFDAFRTQSHRKNMIGIGLYSISVPAAYVHPAITLALAFTVAGLQDGAIDPDETALAQSMTIAIPGVAAVNGGTKTLAAAAGGAVTLYGGDGQAGATYTPFAGYAGALRTAAADFNGDGVADVAVTTGPGVPVGLMLLQW